MLKRTPCDRFTQHTHSVILGRLLFFFLFEVPYRGTVFSGPRPCQRCSSVCFHSLCVSLHFLIEHGSRLTKARQPQTTYTGCAGTFDTSWVGVCICVFGDRLEKVKTALSTIMQLVAFGNPERIILKQLEIGSSQQESNLFIRTIQPNVHESVCVCVCFACWLVGRKRCEMFAACNYNWTLQTELITNSRLH